MPLLGIYNRDMKTPAYAACFGFFNNTSTMNTKQGAEFLTNETKGLAEPHGPVSLAITSERSAAQNLEVCWNIDQWPNWRQQAHDVKAYTVANLDTLLEQFEKNLLAKGITVLWAKDSEEANNLIGDIVRKHDVKNVVKAKSMASEEINFNHALAECGVESLETDLGEYIVQLAGQRPTHIVTPALHLSVADVGHLFEEKLGEPFTAVHQELTMVARKRLRQKFVEADMGLSGVNFGIAETGTLCLIENEGNIGLSTSAPKVHVALMGIEKLLPRLADLPLFLNMLPRMGTGQKLTSYVHMIHGPVPGRKIYLILLDNNRSSLLAQPKHRKMLHCIRCGLCLNNCPVYRHVGGWAYGWVYPGPMGSIITPQLLGVKTAGKLPFACSLCGACSDICPVKVDLAHQMVRLRKKVVSNTTSLSNIIDGLIWFSSAVAMKGNFRFRKTMSLVKFGIRCAPFLPYHPDKLGAWTRGRALPTIPAEGSFRDWWKNRDK